MSDTSDAARARELEQLLDAAPDEATAGPLAAELHAIMDRLDAAAGTVRAARDLASADTLIEVRAGADTITFSPDGALVEQTLPGPWPGTVTITFWVGPTMASLVLDAATTVVATRE